MFWVLVVQSRLSKMILQNALLKDNLSCALRDYSSRIVVSSTMQLGF